MGQEQKVLQETTDTTAQKALNQTTGEDETVIVRNQSKRKTIFLAGAGIVLVLLAIIITCVIAFGDSEGNLQEQLDLGTKYLNEMDYEQALVAFNTALEIDPKNADAYLGIVEVYIRTNDFETALEYAKEGYEVTGDERLKEKIDMIESGSIFASNGWWMKRTVYDGDGNLFFWHEYTYNLQGQKASVAKYNAQGVQEQYLELAYDEEGRYLIGYSWESESGNISKMTYEYNGDNYRATYYKGLSDEVTSYTEMEIDADSNAYKEIYYDADGTVRSTEVGEYDEEDRLVRRNMYNPDNQLLSYFVYTYDENGTELQEQYYDGDGVLTEYDEFVYDAEGNCIGRRNYDADGVLQYEEVLQ